MKVLLVAHEDPNNLVSGLGSFIRNYSKTPKDKAEVKILLLRQKRPEDQIAPSPTSVYIDYFIDVEYHGESEKWNALNFDEGSEALQKARPIISEWVPDVIVTTTLEFLHPISNDTATILLLQKIPEIVTDYYSRKESFVPRTVLRSLLLACSGIVVTKQEDRNALWAKVSRKISPLVLEITVSNIHKIVQMAHSGRLHLWNMANSWQSQKFLNDLGEVAQKVITEPSSLGPLLKKLTLGAVLLLNGDTQVKLALEEAGYQVLCHSLLPQGNSQNFATECIFAPSQSFDHVLMLSGADELPHFEATFAEMKRLARDSIILGLPRKKSGKKGSWWIGNEESVLNLTQGYASTLVEGGDDRIYLVLESLKNELRPEERCLQKTVSDFLYAEQVLNNRRLYPEGPARDYFGTTVPFPYQPAGQQWFRLPYYLIALDQKEALFQWDEDFAPSLRSRLMHEVNGKTHYRFFIHPLTVDLFQKWVGEQYIFVAAEKSEFRATPTSSFRSLLTLYDNLDEPFIVKVSLMTNLTNGSRHIDWHSCLGQFEHSQIFKHCVDINDIVEQFPDVAALGLALKKEITLPENLMITIGPKTVKNFGNVIRTLPRSLTAGQKGLISITSLTSPEPMDMPLIVELSKKAPCSYGDFIDAKVITPLLEVLNIWVLEKGFMIEPHSQNILVEMDEARKLTGRFYYRDFDRMHLDRDIFPRLYPKLWNKYIKDRPDRLTPEEKKKHSWEFCKCTFTIFCGISAGLLLERGSSLVIISLTMKWMFFG